MSGNNNWGTGTQCIQEGYKPGIGEARVLPIYQSTTYKYEDIDQVARLFSLQESGNKYSRTGNPTANALEAKVAALEGGVGALSTATGQAAIFLAISNIVQAGDHIVSSNAIYGGTYTLLDVRLRKLGVETTFVNPEDPIDEIRKVIKSNTKIIIGETIGNPALGILDFEKFASLAKEFDIPFLVDNTLATPFICKPLKHGANVVINSATKYMDGHAVALGGIIVDGGTYNWANGKFPDFVEPDAQYANTSYTGKFGNKAYITKARAQYIRDFGPTLAPIHAFLINLGLETLHLRMPRHSDNALKLAKFLKNSDKVNWVNYPGLEDNKNYPKISKYFDYQGASGVLTFGLKGGYEAIKKFAANLKVAALVVHVGDARTSILHPATSTHSQMSHDQRIEAGITDDMIRVSVGIEDAVDIINDFDQAIKKAFGEEEENHNQVIDVTTSKYFDLKSKPKHIKEQLSISVVDNAYLPQTKDENIQEDWLAFVSVPAFKKIEKERPGQIKSFCSVGTGSGLDVLAGAEIFGAKKLAFTDLQEKVVRAAEKNVKNNLSDLDKKEVNGYVGDLFAPIKKANPDNYPRFDVIYENLPNVPLDEDKDVEDSRNSGHYLEKRKERIPKEVHAAMLDLHFLALQQAGDFLEENGVILSLIGGRVPLDTIISLGKHAGINSEILSYKWKVQSEPEDVIGGYAKQEEEGYGPFIFYKASDLKNAFEGISFKEAGGKARDIEKSLINKKLSATEAFKLWKAGESIGHTVVVLRSSINSEDNNNISDVIEKTGRLLQDRGSKGKEETSEIQKVLLFGLPSTPKTLNKSDSPLIKFKNDVLSHGSIETNELIQALDKVFDHLPWEYGYNVRKDLPDADQYIGWAELIGPKAPYISNKYGLGFLVIGPNTTYPAHYHPAIETYIVLSGRSLWTLDGKTTRKEPGDVILHPSNHIHSMKTEEETLLALYLWTGDDIVTSSVYV